MHDLDKVHDAHAPDVFVIENTCYQLPTVQRTNNRRPSSLTYPKWLFPSLVEQLVALSVVVFGFLYCG